MDNDKLAQIQANFEEWAKANGYSVERIKRAPRYYQDSHTEAAFQGALGVYVLSAAPAAPGKEQP